jgi:hypothetical protein
MRAVPLVLGVVVLAALMALWVANCSGPRPVVQSHEIEEPERPGDPYRVLAVVRNDGLGNGEARVTFRLREPASSEAYAEEKTVELERGATIRVVAEIHAPPRTYEAEVHTQFPIR